MNADSAVREASDDAHLERFEPDDEQQKGKLIEAEHRGRYWWAAQLAEGKDVLDAACGTGYGSQILAEAGASSVTSADVDPAAIEVTRARLGDAAEVVAADLAKLPFDDDSFDLAVCFETIEHVSDGAAAIAEFRRVLRPGGLLLVSSPNPDVYPSGNEHHLHEYRAGELAELAKAKFPRTAIYAQHSWLASAIEPASAAINREVPREGPPPELRRVDPLAPAAQTYSLVIAGEGELPELPGMTTLAGDFEVRWWQDQLRRAQLESMSVAKAEAREAEARRQWEEASAALVQANEALLQAVGVSHQLEDLRNSFESSLSWRLTAPLRRLVKLFRR